MGIIILILFTLVLNLTSAFPSPTPIHHVVDLELRALEIATKPTITTTPTTAIEFTTTEYNIIPGQTNAHITIPGHTIAIALPTCSQTIIPDKNGYVPPNTCNALWDYYPSYAAALVFSFLFGIVTIMHVWQAVFYRKKFCWVVIMAASWETIAFVFRTISTRYQQNATVYLIFQIFVLLAPLWVNAFDYIILGRMIHFFIPSHSLFMIPGSLFAIVFVFFDFACFIVQLLGSTSAGPSAPVAQQMRATHIYMGGIGLQQFFILIFITLVIKFHLQMNKRGQWQPLDEQQGKQWRPLLYTVYITLGLITIRIIFRLVEFSSGTTSSNSLPYHEAYFYLLDAVPMLLALVAFSIVHPGMVLSGPNAEMPGIIATMKGIKRNKIQRGK